MPPPHQTKSPKPPPPTPFFKLPRHAKRGKKHTKHRHRTIYPTKISLFYNSPIENTILLLNKDPSFLISFHNPTPYPSLTSQIRHPASSTPKFLLITCFQRAPLSSTKCQLHLYKTTLLRVDRHLTPKSPLLLSEHTNAHFTRSSFHSKGAPLPKKVPLDLL